jgi:protein gp37
MAETKIQWTAWRDAQGNFQPGYTFNPWIGCTEVSPACDHCYAAALDRKRFSKTLGDATAENPISHWGKGAPRHLTSDTYWKSPRQWAKRARTEKPMDRPRVFCASLADWLDDEVPIEWMARLLVLIYQTPELDWLLLTKRPGNWRDRLCAAMGYLDRDWLNGKCGRSSEGTWIGRWIEAATPYRGMGLIPGNIWIGATVENQQCANDRIPLLCDIPAPVHFLSMEPILEPVDLTKVVVNGGPTFNGLDGSFIGKGRHGVQPSHINWVIVGGESGPDARPTNVAHLQSVVNQCHSYGVPVFVKQLGKLPYQKLPSGRVGLHAVKFVPEISVADSHGSNPDFWPESLRIRQFPELKG